MKLNKIIILVLWLAFLASNPCRGLIVYIYKFSDPSGKEIEIWSDDHFLGTKEDNLEQLKQFLGYIPIRKATHLILESPFFHDFDPNKHKFEDIIKNWNNKLGELSAEKFSFTHSPQRADATTWIAWELPYLLFSIQSNMQLPSDLNWSIDNEKEDFLNELFCKCFDPRPAMAKTGERDMWSLMGLGEEILEDFKEANNNSPKKYKTNMSSYVDKRNINASSDSDSSTYGAQLLDIQILTALSELLNDSSAQEKRIILLCGHWHTIHLREALLLRDFKLTDQKKLQRSPTKVRPDKALQSGKEPQRDGQNESRLPVKRRLFSDK